MKDESIKQLVGHLGRVAVPVTIPGDGTKPLVVGWKWGMQVGQTIYTGEVLISVLGDGAGLIGQSIKHAREAVDDLFRQVGTPVAAPGTHVVKPVLPPPAVVGPDLPGSPCPSDPRETPELPVQAPAPVVSAPQPAQPHPQVGQAQPEPVKRGRGRPPKVQSAQPVQQALPPQPARTPDDETSGFTPEPDGEPGDEPGGGPSEPFGRSGRTLSNLMGTLVTIGKPGGSYRDKTYVQIEASGKLDTFLDYVVKNSPKFAAGGADSAEDWEEQVRTASELLDLRKQLGLYKPAA